MAITPTTSFTPQSTAGLSPTTAALITQANALGSSIATKYPTTNTTAINPSTGSPDVSTQISQANYSSPQKTVSPVQTSNAALQDYQTKLAGYQSTLAAMNQQMNAQAQAQAQAQMNQAQNDLKNSQDNLQQQNLKIQQTQADAANTTAQAKLAVSQPGFATTQTPTSSGVTQTGTITPNSAPSLTSPQTSPTTSSNFQPSQGTLDYTNQIQGIQDERTSALSSFLQTSNSMIIGLQASESALVNATTQQFNNILAAQQRSNESQLGAAKVNAARTGQEYTPDQAAGTIANVISQGNQRLSEINSKMATTLSELHLNFAKEQYDLMNKNFDRLDQNFKERLDTFKEVHDAVAADAAAQQKAQQDSRDFEYKKSQDEILNNLNSAKFTYTQKQDAIDNAFKSKQINETQRHNLQMEAIAKEPTAKEIKETQQALLNAKASIPVMKDKVASVDSLKESPGLSARVGTSFLSRVPTGDGFFGTLLKGAENVVKFPLTLGYGTEKDLNSGITGEGQNFAANVHKLIGGLTLDSLINAKAQGATFGALSEGELNLLANSASTLNDWEIKDSKGQGTGVWGIDENSFKKELDNIKTLTNRALLLSQQNIVDTNEEKELDKLFPKTVDPSSYY